jgi:hypothetical protein
MRAWGVRLRAVARTRHLAGSWLSRERERRPGLHRTGPWPPCHPPAAVPRSIGRWRGAGHPHARSNRGEAHAWAQGPQGTLMGAWGRSGMAVREGWGCLCVCARCGCVLATASKFYHSPRASHTKTLPHSSHSQQAHPASPLSPGSCSNSTSTSSNIPLYPALPHTYPFSQ